MLEPTVTILAGETASGKTALAMAYAAHRPCVIIGADSRQVYAGMSIGTAAPSAAERAMVPHALVEFLDPQQRYSAAQFAHDALAAIDAAWAAGREPLIVGGTGFYIRVLTGEMAVDAAIAAPAFRARAEREVALHGAPWVHALLCLRAPRLMERIHPHDAYRVIRAHERVHGAPDGGQTQLLETLASRGIAFRKFWLRQPGEILRVRIAARVDRMLREGFIEEARRIGADAVAANAVGYPQALAYVHGHCTADELRTLLCRATAQYAKRQRTWLQKEPGIVELDARQSLDALVEQIMMTRLTSAAIRH